MLGLGFGVLVVFGSVVGGFGNCDRVIVLEVVEFKVIFLYLLVVLVVVCWFGRDFMNFIIWCVVVVIGV